MNKLLQNGYLKITNILNDNDYLLIENNMLNDNKIKYFYLKKFIDEIFLQKINNKLNWNCLYTKFRFSNNNNSNDASLIHRDIQSYTNKLYPIFTCLTYLDDSSLEIIPGSHLNTHYSLIESLFIINKTKTINMKRGDILIFYSTLLHRGLFYNNNNKNRRLLQLFDVYQNEYDYNKYSSKILHVLGNNTHSNFLIEISKYKIFINFLNLFGLLNSATGYGYNNNIMSLLKLSNFTHISQEGLSKRLNYNENKYQKLNLYFINKDNVTLSEDKYKIYLFYCYNKQFIIYSIIFIIIIIIICKLFSHYFKK